jgi:Fe-S-cluster containining protein
VFLSKKDAGRLAAELQMGYTEFVETYCRWVPAGGGLERLSLKEKSNFDCIFWKDGCSAYAARPLQCRTFPFWPAVLDSAAAWELAKSGCPGMGRGTLVGRAEIEARLAAQEAEPALTRQCQRAERA